MGSHSPASSWPVTVSVSFLLRLSPLCFLFLAGVFLGSLKSTSAVALTRRGWLSGRGPSGGPQGGSLPGPAARLALVAFAAELGPFPGQIWLRLAMALVPGHVGPGSAELFLEQTWLEPLPGGVWPPSPSGEGGFIFLEKEGKPREQTGPCEGMCCMPAAVWLWAPPCLPRLCALPGKLFAAHDHHPELWAHLSSFLLPTPLTPRGAGQLGGPVRLVVPHRPLATDWPGSACAGGKHSVRRRPGWR